MLSKLGGADAHFHFFKYPPKIHGSGRTVAQSDLVLSISPSEIRHIKGCNTSREIWLKLERIYQSKRPARKATLLNRLILIKINEDLLAILLLYSLPRSYENFRCAIESRDEVLTSKALKVKIIEETDARKSQVQGSDEKAMVLSGGGNKRYTQRKPVGSKGLGIGRGGSKSATSQEPFKYRCHRCRKIGKFEKISAMKNRSLNLENRAPTEINAKGTVKVDISDNHRKKILVMENALHVPHLHTNLLPVSKITDTLVPTNGSPK